MSPLACLQIIEVVAAVVADGCRFAFDSGIRVTQSILQGSSLLGIMLANFESQAFSGTMNM